MKLGRHPDGCKSLLKPKDPGRKVTHDSSWFVLVSDDRMRSVENADAIDAIEIPDRRLAWQNPMSRVLHTRRDKFRSSLNSKYGALGGQIDRDRRMQHWWYYVPINLCRERLLAKSALFISTDLLRRSAKLRSQRLEPAAP